MIPNKDDIIRSATFKTSRSGGSGGQHVNKVSSKVELIINIQEATFLNDLEKNLISSRLGNRIDQEGNLHITSQEDRSQLLNKERTILKAITLFKAGLHIQKVRKPTKVPKAVVRKRLDNKQTQGVKKINRKKPQIEH